MEKEILKQWEDFGAQILGQFGLTEKGWKMSINSRKNAVGLCNHTTRTIYVSVHFLEESEVEVIYNTILHEIAHALVGPNQGHNAIWRAKAKEIGCTATRCAVGAVSTASYNYEISCSACGKVCGRRHRLKKNLLTRYRSNCCYAPLSATSI